MDIFCRVEGQHLLLDTPPRIYAEGSDNFVRFLFTMSADWTGLLTFAQFRQFDRLSNEYLMPAVVYDEDEGVNKSYMAATLPGWLKPGPVTMLLCGTGNNTVIGTTNHVFMHVLATGLVDNDITTGVDETLYQQLVGMVRIVNTYDSMALMAADMGLADGMVAKTRSYYAGLDYGGAEYDIIALEGGSTAPAWWVYLHDNLYARIRGDKIYPEQIGAHRDGTHNDVSYIQAALDSGKVVGLSRGTYYVYSDSETDTALTITDSVKIEGDDTIESIIAIDAMYGITINSGCSKFTRMWTSATLLNIHIVGVGNGGHGGDNVPDTCIIGDRFLANPETGYVWHGYWGESFCLEHFRIDKFLCPFRIYSAYQLIMRDGVIYECGTGVFSYYGDDGETFVIDDHGKVNGRQFSNQCYFDSVFFDREPVRPTNPDPDKTYSDVDYVPHLELTWVRSFTFVNCAFQNAPRAFNSRGRGTDIRCFGCWFEGLDYVYNFDQIGQQRTRNYLLDSCFFADVKAYKQYNNEQGEEVQRNVDAHYAMPTNILCRTHTNATVDDLVHGNNGGQILCVRASNLSDIYNQAFEPYSFQTNQADIRLPFNTLSKEVYRKNTASIDLVETTVLNSNNVGCLYTLFVYVYQSSVDPEVSGSIDHYYIAEYKIYKQGRSYFISEPRVIAAESTEEDEPVVSVNNALNAEHPTHGKGILTFTANMVDPRDHSPIAAPTAMKMAVMYNVLPFDQTVRDPDQ